VGLTLLGRGNIELLIFLIGLGIFLCLFYLLLENGGEVLMGVGCFY
jgi:hypothetical protein